MSDAITPPTGSPQEEKKDRKPLTSVRSLGISHDRNARYRRTMEDAHVFVDGYGDDEKQGFFAIYDGHGGRGAVEYVASRLHLILLDELKVDPSNVPSALTRAYIKTDDEIEENKIQFSGTTAVTCLIRYEEAVRKLYTANVGDARAILCRNGQAVRLTCDHKGTDEAEIQRIQDAGGFVIAGRVNGILAVTRSLGDRAMKKYVSGEPYTEEHTLTAEDTHLIIACDGIWDVISDQQACDIARNAATCGDASRELLVTALRNGSTDNISVMVILL